VVSFSITCENDEGDLDTEKGTGNLFTPKIKEMLRRDAKSGRTLTVDEIRVLGPDGKTTGAPSLVYYIK